MERGFDLVIFCLRGHPSLQRTHLANLIIKGSSIVSKVLRGGFGEWDCRKTRAPLPGLVKQDFGFETRVILEVLELVSLGCAAA